MRPFAEGETLSPHKGELRQLAVRGAGVTVLSGGFALAIQIASTVILSRLLAPHDFGVVAMVTTFSLLISNFGLNGFTEAIVQREKVDHALASTLFWINLSAGLLLTLGFASAGTLLARFYHDTQVRIVAIAIAPTIVLTSTSVIHLALLKRAMQFPRVSFNDILARLLGITVSIILGSAGCGYWALIAGALTIPLSTTIGAWILCRWVPGFPRHVAGTKAAVAFALHTYGRFSFNYFARNTDNLLVGWRFNATALGFYKKAYDMFTLTANQLVGSIYDVAVSTLSRVRDDSAQYRRYLLGALTFMVFIGMGISAELTVTGKDIIRVLLGPRWEPSGRIFTFFGPGIGIMVLYHTHGWIHLSIGRADRWFRWGIVEFFVTFLLFIAALPWGPVGIAIAWTSSFWILTVPAFWYAGKPINLSIRPILGLVWKYVVAALTAGLVTESAMQAVSSLKNASGAAGAFLRIAIASVFLVLVYLACIVLLHGGTKPLQEVATIVSDFVPRRLLQHKALDSEVQPANCAMAPGKGESGVRTPGEPALTPCD